MTQAKDYKFTTEAQLADRYTNEIANFWQQGQFSEFTGANNSRINYATFIHNPVESLAHYKSVVVSPGRGESYLKYKELSYDLFNLGFNVFLIDHRGQGLSERALRNPHKGYIENFQFYVDDFSTFVDNIVTSPSADNHTVQKPYILAHSMGSAIAARYLQDHPDKIQAAVLSSPMLGFNSGGVPDFIALSLVKTSAKFNQWFDETPWYFFGHKDYTKNDFTDNPLMHSALRFKQFTQLYQDISEIQLGGVTIKWLTESITALDTIFNNIDKITTPTLVIQAGADTIVSNKAQNDFCKLLHQQQPQSCPTGRPVVVKEALHELFFESDEYRHQALRAAINWFRQH